MSERLESENTIPQDLLQAKLFAFQGVKARNNRLVLGYFASHGRTLPYVVYKDLYDQGHFDEKQYPTVYRRIKALAKGGYLTEAGTRTTRRGKQSEETLYSLTSLGWVASLAIDSIRKDLLATLKRNVDTVVPDNRTIFDHEVNVRSLIPGLLGFVEVVYSEEEIYALTTSLLLGYLKTSAPSLDELSRARTEEWLPFIKPIFEKVVIEERRLLPRGISRTVNLFSLLDDPIIFDFVVQLLPIISLYAEDQIITHVRWFIAVNGLKDIFNSMDSDEKPSESAEAFFGSELPKLLQAYQDSFLEQRGDIK